MLDYPKTREETKKIPYRSIYSNNYHVPYDEDLCAFQVADGYQCSRKSGHGHDGLYCKQHAKMIAKAEQINQVEAHKKLLRELLEYCSHLPCCGMPEHGMRHLPSCEWDWGQEFVARIKESGLLDD